MFLEASQPGYEQEQNAQNLKRRWTWEIISSILPVIHITGTSAFNSSILSLVVTIIVTCTSGKIPLQLRTIVCGVIGERRPVERVD